MSTIDNLRKMLAEAAAKGPFKLDSTFLTEGLDDPQVSVPPDYDKNLQAAFQVKQAADFLVSVEAGDVGPVADDSFTVKKATIPFLGRMLEGGASLVFALTNDGKLLVVQIESSPANWTWTDSFEFMNGFPFNQLPVSVVRFVFSTAAGKYPWGNAQGQDVLAGAKQNFFSNVSLPTVVKPLLVLFDGLSPPSGDLELSGALDLSTYNGTTVLFPAATLDAVLNTSVFKMLYLEVSLPRINLSILAPADATGTTIADTMQTPTLAVAADIQIGQDTSPYVLKVAVTPPLSQGASGNAPFSIGLMAKDDASPLTPATIIDLVGGGGSYFSATPPVLQQFLALVGLQGLSLAGVLGTPPNVTSIGVRIGSSKNTSWTPIPNAPAGLNFTITSFYLDWTLLNPFDRTRLQQTFLMGAQFTLAPAVFKGPGGKGDGIFKVQFTSALQFSAEFDGTAKLSDFLSTLTGGVVSLPASIEASLSQIRLDVDFTEQDFSFTSGYEVSLAFLKIGDKPIISISDGQVSVSAQTPTQNGGNSSQSLALINVGAGPNAVSNTVWQSEISGLMAIGPLTVNATVSYDGFQSPPRWNLKAALAQEIDVEQLIKQFFDPTGSYQFPDFLPGHLKVKTLAVDAVIPSGKDDLSISYSVDTSFSWLFKFGDQTVGVDPARINLAYDGSKPSGQQLSGLAEGTWVYDAINLQLLLGYKFQPVDQDTKKVLYVQWEGFRAEYESGKEQIIFSLKGWSLGTLIQALVRTLGDPYFTLPSPWDLLNKVSLDGLSISVSLKSEVSNRLSASYTLSSPLNLGFITINGLIFRRDPSGKVTLAIDGTIPSVLLDNVPPEDKQKLQNLTNKDTGQDVQDMPTVPGRGQEYFKLFLLVLGQRIGITGYTSFENTKDVICALQNVPNTKGKTNPVNPKANQGAPPKGLPYYNQSNNWLIAAHLGLLKVGNAWTVDAMVVFNDPNLYGLRLALAGSKAGGLANLAVDVLYKKITDDIGVFQIDFTFPDAIRNLNFGMVSITLPQLGIKVYTNGDFFIDIGFPYNLDFRRSFSIAAIVYGVPVLGSGGLYFGKLSNATATQVPKTNNGTFDPVIVFGLGLQLGLGYNFTKGPLSAGFALTVFGIVEGVIAPWHAYDQSSRSTALTVSDGVMQSDYYFKLSGMVGLIGLLYGKVDFAIIQAAVNVKITLSLQITYESYRAIPLVMMATVDISLKVKIDLGLFSISVSLSFSATVSAKFVLGSDQTAPWDDQPALESFMARRLALLSAGPDAARLRARALNPRPKRVVLSNDASKPTLKVLTAPQFTVLAPEGSIDYLEQQGTFVFLLAMDAPDATSKNDNTGDTSFDQLCANYFPWMVDALGNAEGNEVDLTQASTTIVTRAELEAYIEKLADIDDPPFTITDLLDFMQSSFNLNIETPSSAKDSGTRQAMEAGATMFPVFDGLSLSVPDPSGSGDKPIDFELYATATSAYRKTVAEIFAEVEAVIEQQNQGKSRLLAADDDHESMAALIFVDTFSMIGRQLLQAALDALDSYAYELKPEDSIQSIMDWANHAGNNLWVDDVAVPNQEHQLSPAIKVSIEELAYTIQAEDTLATIATRYSDPDTSAPRWTTTPAQFIESNGKARVLQPNVNFTVQGKDGPVDYTTCPGDSFQNIADTVGIELSNLASQSVLYTIERLLTPAQWLSVPPISYTTAKGASPTDPSPDTLGSVAALFSTTVPNLAASNTEVQRLFSMAAEQGMITLANLGALAVSDLWTSVQATDQIAQTAGMVSRFLLFGLRLPNKSGLELSDQFLYPTGQQGYGLYQLTGQQFPTPASLGDSNEYRATLSRADSAHGVDLSFIQFNGAAGTSAQVDLADAYGRLSIVLDWAKTGAFQPTPTFDILPLSSLTPKAFVVKTFSFWSTSDIEKLESLTDRDGSIASDSHAQTKPILCSLPPGLLSQVETCQTSLESLFGGLSDPIPLLPQFKPQVGSTSPSNPTTTYTDIKNWAWATRVDFQVKKLPASQVTALAGTGSGSTPSGPASEPSLPNVYELVGPSSEDALRLERILSAIDALGEDIASAVFLLYEQSGSSTTELVTLGDQEFLSFITQTNLSTETNPERSTLLALAARDGKPPRGIANSPGEFVKLLWELSMVRSGGYYLFYQVVESGDALPASIFDTSGTATLSMVITYAAKGSHSFGNSVLDFVNSFVTTDSIDTGRDIVRVLSQPASGKSAQLSGAPTETLGSLAATYGVGPGRIAEVNSSTTLAEGKVIPVNGIVRQLQQADVTDPSKTLENLAAYYSVGAQIPITPQDIQNMNPGVSVELGSVFYIPTVKYVVDKNLSPGNSFESMSQYYDLSVDAMAVNALKVGGLFPTGTTLDIDTQLFDLHSTLGPGNIGVRLERVNLGEPKQLSPDPTPEEKEAYAKAYMYSLYNTLSAGFSKNVFFTSSPMGLPFGPQDHSDDGVEATFMSHAKAKERRRARLLAAAEKNFDYRQFLGFGKFCQINPAPDPSAPGLPCKSDNPYIGVGSTAQVALRWQGIFGNTTVTPFEKPPANYTGALEGCAATILYNDRLIGVAAWPNVQASYIYGGEKGAPELNINFALDTSSYDGNKEQAERDLALYERVYFQLHQDYTDLGVPGATGNAVSMVLRNSLLADPDTELSDDQAKIIRDFVSDCVQYLASVVSETGKVNQPTAKLSLPVPLDALASGNVIELDVALTFERQALLTEPSVAALAEGLAVTSVILPQADRGDTVAYVEFATAFEQFFQSPKWYMKVGEGLRKTHEGGDQRSQQLWAVRFGREKGEGIYFEIGTTPSYYAPKPVAKSLESKAVSIIDYTTEQTVQSSFTGVDQNLWLQTCLDAIDTFLSADYSSSAFILDKILGTDDPLKDGYLGKVMKAKQSLADNISATIEPILSTSATDNSTQWAASEKLRQQMLNQIGAAYAAGAVIVFGLSDVSGAPPSAPDGPPNLYGQPTGGVNSSTVNQNYTLSTAKIPLGSTTVYDNDGDMTYDPRLALLFMSKNVAGQAYVPLNLSYKISHLEFDRTMVPGIEGYMQSRWLVFVNGPFEYKLGTDTSNIPVVNRTLPMPPTMQKQSAARHTNTPTRPSDLAKWDYSFEYLHQHAAQDAVQVEIEFNLSPDNVINNTVADETNLFQTLAQFVSSYPAISRDFTEYLTKIDAEEPDDETVNKAKKAVSKFSQYVTDVAARYALAMAPKAVVASAKPPELVRITFLTSLGQDEDGNAQTQIMCLLIDDLQATWDQETNTISNGEVTLPAVVVQIDPCDYEVEVVEQPPENVVIAYRYKEKESRNAEESKYLCYDKALGIPLRIIAISALDVLAYQNAWSSIYVQRNKILFPVEESGVSTTGHFLFQTPIVKFADPIVPQLVYEFFSLDVFEDNLEASLNVFYQGLFSAGNGTTSVEVSMTSAYSYLLIPDMQKAPRIFLPINMLPPTETAVDPSNPPSFTDPFARSICHWRAANNPAEEGEPQVNLKLWVFGASSAKQPIVMVNDMSYSIREHDLALP